MILHMIRKPNSIILFYYSFKIIPSLKTWLKHAYLTFRVVQLRKYSPNSRCCPSSCLLAVLAMFLAI